MASENQVQQQQWIKVTLPDGRQLWDGPFDRSEVRSTMNFILAYLPEGTLVELSPVWVV